MNLFMQANKISQRLIREHEVLSYFPKLASYLLRNPSPEECMMMTVEFHDLDKQSCVIVFYWGDTADNLGRVEKYQNCIFSEFEGERGTVVLLNEVNKMSGYLSLDDRVRSEMFFEYRVDAKLHLILNGEFSCAIISPEIRNWFGGMVDLLP